MALEKSRNRAVRRLELALFQKPDLDLGQCQVGLASDQGQQPVRMVVQRRGFQLFGGLFRKTACRCKPLKPFDRG